MNRRLDQAEDRTCELKDKSFEITQLEAENKKEKIEVKTWNLRVKHIMGVQEVKEIKRKFIK